MTALTDFVQARLAEEQAAALTWVDVAGKYVAGVTYRPDIAIDVPGEVDLVAVNGTGAGATLGRVVELCLMPWLASGREGHELAARILYAIAASYRGHPDYEAAVASSPERMVEEYPPSHLAEGRPVPAAVGERMQARDGTWWVAEGPTSWTEVPADGSGPLQLEEYAAVMDDAVAELAEATGTPPELLSGIDGARSGDVMDHGWPM